MKKRMFITTIVMMLVLAVALTTSSLAWFSSSQTFVTASAATFRATSQGTSNVNIKISDSTDTWRNEIALHGEKNDTARSMVGMIPVSPLISDTYNRDAEGQQTTQYTFPETTGVFINGVYSEVKHADYKWPAYINFNSAKIGDESNFIISATGNNAVTDYGHGTSNESIMSNTAGDNVKGGYFYQEFYIHNADTQATISQLKFELNATHAVSGTEAYDYTCDGFAAFILYDAVPVKANDTVPDNAIENAGKTVLEYGATVTNTLTQVAATSEATANVTDYRQYDYYTAWIPFAIFTYIVPGTGTDTTTDKTFQFANLNATDENDAFVYQNDQIDSLDTQEFDAISGNTGFTLNANNLAKLNDKVVNASGDVTNTNTVRDDITAQDYDCAFSMKAGETYRVSLYYWFDGFTMTAFTDTTVTSMDLRISVPE